MITCDGKTKLTSETERLFVELGGADPSKTFTQAELSDACVKAIEFLAEHGKFSFLERIYQAALRADPSLPSLEELKWD